MKIKRPLKSNKQKKLAKLADKLGTEYKHWEVVAKTSNATLDKKKAEIKEIAEGNGVQKGKTVVLVGKSFIVGYTSVPVGGQIDVEKAFEVLGSKRMKKIARRKIVWEAVEKRVKRAVESGLIKPEELVRCLTPITYQKRILVHPKRN